MTLQFRGILSAMGIFHQTDQLLGIVAVDYSENHPDKKSDCCHTKRDKVVS